MITTRWAWLGFVLGLAIAGCAPDAGLDEASDEGDVEMSEDELNEPGFDRHRVLGDTAFTDSASMSQAEIQAFLDETPYGGRSVLATHVSGGRTAAQAIYEAAQEHRINPLLILTRAQLEMSLVAKSTATAFSLNYAFGCGCPDYQDCSTQWKGFDKQVQCMAGHMREYLDDLEGGGSTIAGWQIGRTKKTLDRYSITPKNAATAALYTYTPWVGTAGSGNLGHFRIWKKFAGFTGYVPEGPGGCTAERYPSGLLVQTFPAPAMTEAYGAWLGPVGLASANVPTCFLDVAKLEDPLTGVVAPRTSKVASNFAFSEFVSADTSRNVLLDPAFVERLQVFRQKVGASVSVVDGYRSPERHREECDAACGESSCLASCEATLPLALGQGALVSADVSDAAMIDAAVRAGFSTCWMSGGELYVDVAAPGRGCPAN